jgi:hypothetical protein
MGHEPKETLVATMAGHKRLEALIDNFKRESSLLGSSMGSRIGFWRKSELGSTSTFRSRLLK